MRADRVSGLRPGERPSDLHILFVLDGGLRLVVTSLCAPYVVSQSGRLTSRRSTFSVDSCILQDTLGVPIEVCPEYPFSVTQVSRTVAPGQGPDVAGLFLWRIAWRSWR